MVGGGKWRSEHGLRHTRTDGRGNVKYSRPCELFAENQLELCVVSHFVWLVGLGDREVCTER